MVWEWDWDSPFLRLLSDSPAILLMISGPNRGDKEGEKRLFMITVS